MVVIQQTIPFTGTLGPIFLLSPLLLSYLSVVVIVRSFCFCFHWLVVRRSQFRQTEYALTSEETVRNGSRRFCEIMENGRNIEIDRSRICSVNEAVDPSLEIDAENDSSIRSVVLRTLATSEWRKGREQREERKYGAGIYSILRESDTFGFT